LTGKWTGVVEWTDNGMNSWWHHCVLISFVPSFQILNDLLYYRQGY